MDNKGPRPSAIEAVRAMCAVCTCKYLDGRIDCQHQRCPLYIRMPYRKLPPKIGWVLGPWSKYYTKKCNSKKMSIVQYAKSHMMKNGKLHIPIKHIFRAKCYSCNNNYNQDKEPGRIECAANLSNNYDMRNCPLYWWTPYRRNRPIYDWMFDAGHTKKHELKRVMLGMNRDQYLQHVLGEDVSYEYKDCLSNNDDEPNDSILITPDQFIEKDFEEEQRKMPIRRKRIK